MLNTIVIKKPIISEKSLKEVSEGIYTFEVDLKATKTLIKTEIENLFKVHVEYITTAIMKGKMRSVGKRRVKIKMPNIKKARAKLKNGEKIPLFEVGQTK
ncbi:50S ribosomal protein L23 [Candidatus Gottesmanbacteria bacterium RIFCSPLOWO2_01_FULL_39_12b]|uniref:Large ribosomal subunit protein uL23 n=1 Tax=Candidatus Gottesmanbacteria bacterium RIFCSPLOWO2_01_FULL_39_12b TaxID=1798388 RepID=A0A1F6ARI4_9BACT|nr:MAG: 50S ribosomal protein L23 [Candidatus Gottesmanbacteria bacterium RIFCSPLOWO2_01_FULL_39_12b]